MAEGPVILVVGPNWVGDMVMAQTLFSALRELHPDAAIDVIAPAWSAPILKRMPEVRQRLDTPARAGKFGFGARRKAGRQLRGVYDQSFVLPGSWKSALIPFFARIPKRTGYLREMRYGLLNDIRDLPDALKRRTAEAFFNLAGGGTFRAPRLSIDMARREILLAENGLAPGFVALMPGAEFGPAKRWPSENYAALARDFLGRGIPVALFGSPKDTPVAAEILALASGAVDLTGRTTLEDAVDLLSAACVSITNDSGLMHIAAAVDIPVVAVYGSTSGENTPPLTDRRELISLNLDCSPCHQRECPLGHLNCLVHLPPNAVIEAANRLI